jgi:hypothetical protein
MKVDVITNGYLDSPFFVAGERIGNGASAFNINYVKAYARNCGINIASCAWDQAEALMQSKKPLIISRQSPLSESLLFNVERMKREHPALWEMIESLSE